MKTINQSEITASPRRFLDHSSLRSTVDLYSVRIGRGVYQSGWQWSKHAKPQTGKASARHIGWVESGSMCIQSPEGQQYIVNPGDFFEIGPNHDAWVIGSQPCIAFDFTPLAIKDKV